MNNEKKKMNLRACLVILSLLFLIGLPITGLLLHESSEQEMDINPHTLFTLHIGIGILFLISVISHITINRRPLARYIKSQVSGAKLLSREAFTALLLFIIIISLIIIFAH
jgi:cytochrome b561